MVAVVELEALEDSLDTRMLELPPVVEMLKQAERFQNLIASGSVVDRAESAQRFGLTRARVTQLLNLLDLHPVVLAFARSLPAGTPPRLITERKLRRLTQLPKEQQIAMARIAKPGD